MATEWYAKIMGTEHGPLTANELRRMASQGQLMPDSFVKKGEQGRWVTADTVMGLFDVPAEVVNASPTTDTHATTKPAQQQAEPPRPQQAGNSADIAELIQHPVVIVLALIVFFPVGLAFVWIHRQWTNQQKWIWTGCTAGVVLLAAMVSAAIEPEDETADEDKTAEIEPAQAKPERKSEQQQVDKGPSLKDKIKSAWDDHKERSEAKRQEREQERLQKEREKAEREALSAKYRIVSADESRVKVGSSVNIRMSFRIIVDDVGMSKDDLRSVMISVVKNHAAKNPDIDEMAVYAYDREADVRSIYTLGRLEWCPDGRWDGVTSQIASSNDRSTYKFVVDIRDRVGSPATSRPSEQDFAISDAVKRELDANLDANEDDVKDRVANRFGITVAEVEAACLRVFSFNFDRK